MYMMPAEGSNVLWTLREEDTSSSWILPATVYLQLLVE